MITSIEFLNLFLIFVRTLSVFMTAPIFSSRNIPNVAKIGVSILVAMMLLPLVPNVLPPNALTFGTMAAAIAQEVLLGTLIGFVSNLVFMAIGMGVSVMGMQIGFRAASLFNPLINVSSAALDQFYSFLAAALFLSMNGHHWLILALQQTFQRVPPGTFVFTAITTQHLVDFTGDALLAAMRIALPVMGALLLADVGLGLVARAVPQVQVFFLSLPLKIGLGLVALALTLTITLPIVKTLFAQSITDVMLLANP